MCELAGGAGCLDTWLHEVRAVGIKMGRGGEGCVLKAVLEDWKAGCYLADGLSHLGE